MQYTPKFSERWAMPGHWPTANVKLQAILPITNVKIAGNLANHQCKIAGNLPNHQCKIAGNLANHKCKTAGNLCTLREASCSIQQVFFYPRESWYSDPFLFLKGCLRIYVCLFMYLFVFLLCICLCFSLHQNLWWISSQWKVGNKGTPSLIQR